uniref:Uncharacterized protein n=1 Tax=viral metagenome TaxID=1070528 RepID=A0A6C0H946_9ZZZZ
MSYIIFNNEYIYYDLFRLGFLYMFIIIIRLLFYLIINLHITQIISFNNNFNCLNYY